MTRCPALLLAAALAVPALARADDDQADFARYQVELRRVLVVAAAPADAAGSTTTTEGARSGCKLGADQPTTSAECTSCHGAQSHPVDVDYALAAAQRPGSFRAPAQVIARGVFLADGQLTCLTCHDARSPWKYRIALPPGATPRPAVDPHSYGRAVTTSASAPLQPGAAVTPTPLCRACHTIGD